MNFEDIAANYNPAFSTVDELCEYLKAQEHEETVFFENPSFVKAITGITDSGQLIYDYNLMIAAAMGKKVGLVKRLSNGLIIILFVQYHIWEVVIQ